MEKVNTKIVASSIGATAGILSLLCTLFIALFGASFVKAMGYMLHGLVLESAMKPITFAGVAIGFIEAVIIGAIMGVVFGSVYNWLARRSTS